MDVTSFLLLPPQKDSKLSNRRLIVQIFCNKKRRESGEIPFRYTYQAIALESLKLLNFSPNFHCDFN